VVDRMVVRVTITGFYFLLTSKERVRESMMTVKLASRKP
jgi:hypothetical protein